MLRNLIDWFVQHSIVTDPYAAAAAVGALAAAVFMGVWDYFLPWLRFQLRRPATLLDWCRYPVSAAARRRYRIGAARKDITRLQGLAAAVHGDLADTHGRLAELLDPGTGTGYLAEAGTGTDDPAPVRVFRPGPADLERAANLATPWVVVEDDLAPVDVFGPTDGLDAPWVYVPPDDDLDPPR